jgi:ATP-dependent exoDNAse (exonuclease V) alpha subunit
MFELTDEQLIAICQFKHFGISLVDGRPGSGKTTLIEHLNIDNEETLLCTPTGNASDRIFMATKREAHVISKIFYSADLIQRFQNSNVVVDESSMLNIDDVFMLLSCLKPKRICFIGDQKQLQCVGGVPFFATLLKCSTIVKTQLLMNHRQKSLISGLVQTLMSIGSDAFHGPIVDDNFKIFQCSSQAQVIASALEQFKANPNVQMLAISNEVCRILNSSSSGFTSVRRIVCKRNVYVNEVLMVANGMTGFLQENGDAIYDNGFVDVKSSQSKPADARCVTVHSCQGSEFDIDGILVLSGWGGAEFPLELIYTALSRFKNRVIVFGTRQTIQKAFFGRFNPGNVSKMIISELN